MYYHVRLTPRSNRTHTEVKLDLSEGDLRNRVLVPYDEGQPIVIGGRTFQSSDIERLNITVTDKPSSQILPTVLAERQASNVIVMGISDDWYIADKGTDVTDKFITGPPGEKKMKQKKMQNNTMMPPSNDSRVFVVHGHDENLKYQVELFLREIGLDPIVLHRQADQGRTLIEKLEAYSGVSFAFILLTPDDFAYLSKEEGKEEKTRSKEYRARQNVIFEFGYFVGKLGRNKVCCLYKPEVTLPTDVSGLLYKQVVGTIEQLGYELIKELKASGFIL